MKARSYLPWLALGLLIRLAYVILTGPEYLLQGDAGYYYTEAKAVSQGHLPDTYWPPGLPLLAGFFLWVAGPSPYAVFGGMILIYALSTWLIQKALEIENLQQAAPWVHAAWALYPSCIHHSCAPLTQLPAAVLVLAMYLIFRKMLLARSSWPAVVYGLVTGLALLIRPASFSLSGYMLARWGYYDFPKWIKALPGLVLGCLMIVLPWQSIVYAKIGKLLPVNEANGYNLFLGNNPWTPLYHTWQLGSHDLRADPAYKGFYELRDSILAMPRAERQAAWTREAQQHIAQRPDLFLLRSLSRALTFCAFDTYAGANLLSVSRLWGVVFLFTDAILFCVIILPALAVWVLRLPGPEAIPAYIAAYALPYLLVFSHPTYHLPLVPLCMLSAAAAFEARESLSIREVLKSRKFLFAALVFALIQAIWVASMAGRLGG